MFAQLTVRGKWEGPHVFVVRLRDDQGRTMPGVRILDNGAKVGRHSSDPCLLHATCASGMGVDDHHICSAVCYPSRTS